MDASSQADIIAIAKEQLGFPKHVKDSRVPKAYVRALRHHLEVEPYDTNFTVTLQPKTGYGVVTCLEQGCGATIQLSARSTPDGGKAEGFGSLGNYVAHTNTQRHKQSRLQRVKAARARIPSIKNEAPNELASGTPTETKPSRGGLLARLDTQLNSLSMGPNTSIQLPSVYVSLPPSRSGTGNSVKPEPMDPVIPRKRTSSSLIHLGVKNEEKPVVAAPFVNYHTEAFEENGLTQPLHRQINAPTAPSNSQSKISHKFSTSPEDRKQVMVDQKPIVTQDNQFPVAHAQDPLLPHFKIRTSKALGHSHDGISRSHQPVASGSHVRLGFQMKSDADFDNSDSMQSDTDEEQLENLLDPWGGGVGIRDPRFDADGDFYGKGKDLFVGPTADIGDIDKFLVAAGNAESFDGNASVDKALQKLRLRNLSQFFPGMSICLLPHQAIGVAWALEREKSSDKGGCLSDEMGLGKTVQIMSVMVANPSKDPICKTNLIVAPVALLDQWKLEIDMKTTDNLKCLVYHGTNKPKRKAELMKYDVVLTTYHTLAFEWPDLEAEQMAKEKARRAKKKDTFIATDSEDDVDRRPKKKRRRELGLLFQVQWYRVILDEAQNIRNRRTRISRSVTDLESVYRWCLTGTPIINGLVDAYALFRFLRFRPWHDWKKFNGHVSIIEKKQPELASTRLQAIFTLIMLRRKKDSMLDGKRLVELPAKYVEIERLEFSPEEREIYQMVEARSQAKFNRFLRAGTVLKNYHQVLVMLLRLRQICSHPALIQETCDALIAADQLVGGYDLKAERARAARTVSMDFVRKLKDKYLRDALTRIEAEKESPDATAETEECPVCMDTFTEPRVTACCHTFCRECIANVLNSLPVQDLEDPRKYKGSERPCPSCRAPISADAIFIRAAFEPTDAELSGDTCSSSTSDLSSDDEMPGVSDMIIRGTKEKGRARRIRKKRAICDSDEDDDEDDMSDFIVEDDEDEEEKDTRQEMKKRLRKRRAMVVESDDDLDEDEREVVIGRSHRKAPASTDQIKTMSRFLPSTKMNRMMDILEKCSQEAPGDKTIIISQWTECLKLVSDYLSEKKIPHVMYQGSMNRNQRDQAVRVFMMGSTAQVMLLSLKCGGVGLNLTRANRIISLDLGWSEAIECQAFDRVHRLGQRKEVFVQRLVIANTVEDRVLALQERKRNLADGSLGEGNGKKIGRLSVRELANLFGLDHRGNAL